MAAQNPEGIWLSPPPRYAPLEEPLPVVEPRLRGQRVPPEPEGISEWAPVASDPVDSATASAMAPEQFARAAEVALANDQVAGALGQGAHQVIGTSTVPRGDKDAAEYALLFVAYSYSENRAVEVLLDPGSLEVLDVRTAESQPAPVDEEIERAVALARGDGRLEQHVADLRGVALLAAPSDPLDARANHRCFDVRFGEEDERLPRYWALVDLSADEVLRAGSVR
jgi:hypothetical protein